MHDKKPVMEESGFHKNNKKKKFKNIFKIWKSTRVRIVTFIIIIVAISLILMKLIDGVLLIKQMQKGEIAELQTSAAIMTEGFLKYESLDDAEKDGAYKKMAQYSAMNFVRIRVVDECFVVDLDTYSSEYRRNIINENVIESYYSGKSISECYSKIGTIETVIPIYGQNNKKIGVLILDKSMEHMQNVIYSVNKNNSIIIVCIASLCGICAAMFISFIIKPYKKAFNIIKDVSDGHVKLRIPVAGGTELKDISSMFNKIMDRSENLDESRRNFVSNVSHELKTPITSIKVLADSLNMQEDVPNELYKEFMQDITSEIDRESKIIEDLLSLVKMDETSVSLNISSVNLNELVELVLKRLKPIAEKKNVEILFESFRPVVAEVDEVKITQVLSNLVENAIKYNKNDGWVHVSLNADYQNFYIRIEDSGIGIPKDCQSFVFDRFYRVDKARSRQTGGTGLGLAIVQSIVLMHHGTIKLYSEEGQGTTFTVRIPLNYVN